MTARDNQRAHGTACVMTVALFALVGSTCGQAPAPAATRSSAETEAFTPGLGEIMTLQQMRHTKLWLAGEAGNWELAGYELKEIGEGFDDAVKFHPTHEESPVAPKDAIPKMMTAPLADVRTAVDKKDPKALRAGVRHAHQGLQRLPCGNQLRLQPRPAAGDEPVSESDLAPVRK